jgi:hypothetical protein
MNYVYAILMVISLSITTYFYMGLRFYMRVNRKLQKEKFEMFKEINALINENIALIKTLKELEKHTQKKGSQ